MDTHTATAGNPRFRLCAATGESARGVSLDSGLKIRNLSYVADFLRDRVCKRRVLVVWRKLLILRRGICNHLERCCAFSAFLLRGGCRDLSRLTGSRSTVRGLADSIS